MLPVLPWLPVPLGAGPVPVRPKPMDVLQVREGGSIGAP